jgi:drug/metabolite transporter (DMT)-like permease
LQDTKHTKRGIIFTLLGGTCWGFSGTCGQFLFSSESVAADWLTLVRMLSAGVILLALLFLRQRGKMTAILHDKKDLRQLIIFAVLGLVLCQYTYLQAIAYTNAGTATVLQYLGPVVVLAYACLVGRRLPTKIELAAIVLAVLGTAIIATQGDFSKLSIPLNGLLWGLFAAVTLALYTISPERLMKKWGSQTVTAYGMLIGGVVFYLASGMRPLFISLSAAGFAALLGIVIIGTVLSFSLYLQGVTDIGSVKASMLACIEPVAATIFSAAWLGTNFSVMDIIGFAMIITTVIILAKK